MKNARTKTPTYYALADGYEFAAKREIGGWFNYCTGMHPHDYADRGHLSAFAHMATAAINGEQWAQTRITAIVESVWPGGRVGGDSDITAIRAIRAADVTNPNGAKPRTLKSI